MEYSVNYVEFQKKKIHLTIQFNARFNLIPSSAYYIVTLSYRYINNRF